MAEIVLQIRIDADLKNAAEKIYNSMGLNFSDAVRLFAQKSIELGTAPFAISTEKKTAFGALSKYANKNLIPLEKTAWESAVLENFNGSLSRRTAGNFKRIDKFFKFD